MSFHGANNLGGSSARKNLVLPQASIKFVDCKFIENQVAYWYSDPGTKKREPWKYGTELYVNDGYDVDLRGCTLENSTSLVSLVVAHGAPENKCQITGNVTILSPCDESTVFPNTGEGEIGELLGRHADIQGCTAKILESNPILPRHLQNPGCFKSPKKPRDIDTIVIQYASAVNRDTANDRAVNVQVRAAFSNQEDNEEIVDRPREDLSYSLEAVVENYETHGISSHFLIDRSGKIFELVKVEDVAYHAGSSEMPNAVDSNQRDKVNDFSIGIELISKDVDQKHRRVLNGREPGLDPLDLREPVPGYTVQQYSALRYLLHYISDLECCQINLKVVGHEDIDVRGRKKDPGECFNWDILKTDPLFANKGWIFRE